jgi:hypothetical protein
MPESITKSNSIEVSQIIFLLTVIFFVFIVPLFPVEHESTVYSITISIMFFAGVLSLEVKRKFMIWIAAGAFVTEWFAEYFELAYLEEISRTTNIVFFMLMVVLFLVQIAKNAEVDVGVIIQAVIGYLLLGMLFTILIASIHRHYPEAYNFDMHENFTISDYNYYSFVTLSTLGYGDISPQIPISKSLAILETIFGQLYLTIIIALLVGKLLSGKSRNT